jgi:hypothetical protein
MQLNATLRGPALEEEFEEVTQSLDAIKFVETLGNDTNSDPMDDVESLLSETTKEEFALAQIIAGAETAQKYHEELQQDYTDSNHEAQVRYMDSSTSYAHLVQRREDELYNLLEYKLRVYDLMGAIKQQIEDWTTAEHMSIKRSQQYQDRLAANIGYLVQLEELYKHLAVKRDQEKESLRQLREMKNVARIDHPRHGELAWDFCHTDSCAIHLSLKEGTGYWPRKKRPVYWAKPTKNDTTRVSNVGYEQSKN